MASKRVHKVFGKHSEVYTWKTIDCELWSMPYPFKICFNNKKISLLEYDEPLEEYIAFETFLKEGWNKITSKSIYIFRVTEKEKYKVGRSHDVEFHIDDISVSRKHWDIQIIDDKVYLVDEKSKFGSQVLCKNSTPINMKDPTVNMYQMGRTWFMISYQQKSNKSSLFWWFGGNKRSKTNDSVEKDDSQDIEEQQNFLEVNWFSNKLLIFKNVCKHP